MFLSLFSRRLFIGISLALAILGLTTSHSDLVMMESEGHIETTDLYLPNARILKPLLFGHEAFAADLIWIRTLGYVGEQLIARKSIVSLEELVNLVSDLDPRFEQVYIWSGAFLMYSGGTISREKVLASTQFLEKGWRAIQNETRPFRHVSNYWLIPQMIGFNYAMELHDKARGAPYIAEAARIPGVPDLYKTFAATLYKRAGQLEEGTRFLESMLAIETLQAQLHEADDPEVRKRIRDRLEFYYRSSGGEKVAFERLRMLEEKVRSLLDEWKSKAPYLTFNQFLAFRSNEDELADRDTIELWSHLFPHLSNVSSSIQ